MDYDDKVFGRRVERVPVTEEFVISLLIKILKGHVQNKEAVGYLEAFVDVCSSRKAVDLLSSSKPKKPVRRETEFIAIFRDEFHKYYGYKYQGKVDGRHCKMITSLLKRLDTRNASFKDYVRWWFEHFLPSNTGFRHPVKFGAIASTSFLDDYYWHIKDREVMVKVETTKKEQKNALLEQANALFEKSKDKELKKEIKSFRMEQWTLQQFRRFLATKTRELRNKGVDVG